MKTKNLFVVEIEIKEDQWFVLKGNKPLYRNGQIIMIPIRTSTAYHAEEKFKNTFWGSEFPPYVILAVHKCDTGGMFSPIL